MDINAKIKEMIRLNIKPNFAALGREFGCDYRTANKKYKIEMQIEQGVNVNIELDKNVNLGIGQFCTNSFFIR